MNPKILLATGIFPPDIGGPATMLRALAEALLKDRFPCKVITYADRTKMERIDFHGVSVEIFKISRNLPFPLTHLNYLIRLWKLSRWAEVVYSTDVYSVGYFSYLLKKFTGRKYVVRFAGDSAWEKAVTLGLTNDDLLSFQKGRYSPAIDRMKARRSLILQNADRVIAVSRFMSEIAKFAGVLERNIEIIYNSIDFIPDIGQEKLFFESIKEKYKFRGKTIITACRLTPWKGVEMLIKILPELTQKVGPLQLLVVGEGKEKRKLLDLRDELGLLGSVHFVGGVSHDQIHSYFKASDLFILNSQYEGFSHTILEAMKAGVPVVTTNIGGNPEVIDNGSNGLLVPFNDPEAMIFAATKILTSPDFAKHLVVNAREKLKIFQWGNVIRKTEKIFKEVWENN